MAEEKQPQLTIVAVKKCLCTKSKLSITDGQPNGEELYFCKLCSDEMIFCNQCGPALHVIYEHNWQSSNTTSLNEIIKRGANSEAVQSGRLQIWKEIGIRKWLQIKPLVERVPAYVGNTVSAITIFYEMNSAVNNALSLASYTTRNVIKYGTISMLIASAVEVGINVNKWWIGQITGKDLCKLCGKTAIRFGAVFLAMKGGMALGGMAAAKVGTMIGTAVAPGVGTAVGFICGLLAGLAAGWCSSKLYDEFATYDYKSEAEARKKALKEALTYFHFEERDLALSQVFNRAELRKKFRNYALEAHPDKRNGSEAKFHELSSHYGILLAYLEQNYGDKAIILKETLEIEL